MKLTCTRFLKSILLGALIVSLSFVPQAAEAKKSKGKNKIEQTESKKKKKKKRKKKKKDKQQADNVEKEPETTLSPEAILARENYSKAKKYYEEENYAKAAEHFQAAYDAKPHPTVLKSIAECKLQQGDITGAITLLEQYLADPDAPAKDIVATRLQEIKNKMAQVEFNTNPPGAGIMIDGTVTDKVTPAKADLPPGNHEITFNMDGFEPLVKELSLADGEQKTLNVDFMTEGKPLEQEPAEEPALVDPFAGQEEEPVAEEESNGPPPAFWVATAVAGVGLISGTVFGTMALSDEDDYKKKQDASIKESGERNAIIADVSFGVAGAAAIVAVITLVANKKGEKNDETAKAKPKVNFLPVADQSTVGVATSITF